MKIRLLSLLLLSVLVPRAQAALTDTQRAAIDSLTGAKGAYTADEDTYRVTFPRNDLKSTIEGRAYAPFMGFTSWAAFTSAGTDVMVMGDFVLTEDEVNPVMSVALDGGLEVTALHNHFFYVEPRVMFMHIGGHGSVEKLAPVVQKRVARSAEIRGKSAAPAGKFEGPLVPDANAVSAAPLETIFGGVKGEVNSGMFKVTIGRKATMHGATVSKQMGVNTWAAFAGSDAAASVDGDFVVTASELQPVLKSLRGSGINIVAIHSHMTEEAPRYIFLHYWGKGAAADLARGLSTALTLTGK